MKRTNSPLRFRSLLTKRDRDASIKRDGLLSVSTLLTKYDVQFENEKLPRMRISLRHEPADLDRI
ncbi:MAG: hypothetical protein QGG36_07740 [Pirellulaceae bacterium]|nr:hypothetical protein [Pirellulaceae bacterium]MDP7015676.1 hypothetical protein [Pirellulaceae bacterium]